MSDNFVANAGSGGSTFLAQDVGSSVLAPVVKALVGPHGTAQDGWTPHKLISAATTNATSVKASAAQLGVLVAINVSTVARFLKLYNKASAPTVGTDTPVWVVPIPAGSNGAGVAVPIPGGLAFSTGLAYAITANIADSDNTAVAAGDVVVNLGYA